MIARVSLEIALRKEFDYLIPAGLAGQVDVGSRVQVPFGPRKILGVRHRAWPRNPATPISNPFSKSSARRRSSRRRS